MGEIINLRQVRKAREKAEKDAKAAENRVAFGRPKKQKTLQEKRKVLEEIRHEGHRLGHRLERDDPPA
ncbi:DUF4169 family protein [Methylobacterium gregans]|uniref:DUF4169 domain-containing protein n=1 Tax=Methylobacterium gregans TaxID=374424 RepID=A0AA37MA88_9HYPH|nr:DUF4169 family protein [Methylobacterium gregans]MDQ0521422.1 hypothetical protein [Methylobacterium gregans]GJD78092.1 hypothetical protein NBEOAGPD_1304 [Methylobacterium gregans]GLS54586.1 hypothetical protein GCM10007886_27690 [Methylobacterium gregans]